MKWLWECRRKEDSGVVASVYNVQCFEQPRHLHAEKFDPWQFRQPLEEDHTVGEGGLSTRRVGRYRPIPYWRFRSWGVYIRRKMIGMIMDHIR